MSEVSAYLQPDRYDSDNKNSDFIGQNPLLLLARTCQNIGVEPKSTSANSSSSSTSSISSVASKSNVNGSSRKPSLNGIPFSVANAFNNKVQPNRTVTKTSSTVVPPVQTFSPPHPPSLNGSSPKVVSQTSNNNASEDSEVYIPPSSNSLIQLARLSSSLKLPSPSPSERQKRTSKAAFESTNTPSAKFAANLSLGRPQKRARRQSFGRTAKPLDFSSHFSSHSSPLSTSSSSVSPSSLRSTPPSHTSPPPPNTQVPPPTQSSFEFIKNLAVAASAPQPPPPPLPIDATTSTPSSSSTSANPLETFYNVGALLGASPDNLRELLVSIARSMSDRRVYEANHQQQLRLEQRQLQQGVSDPSTQCLYCGHVCADMGNLVQHIYTHLASLHKQQAEASQAASHAPPPPPPQMIPPPPPPPPPSVSSTPTFPFDLAAFYAKLLQKPISETLQTPVIAAPTTQVMPTDPNSLFLAWLNVFRPTYATEGLTGAATNQ